MPKILVTERQDKTRRMLARFLESKGFEVRAAAETAEAVGVLRTFRPDALAVGLGCAAVRQLRAAGVEEPVLFFLSDGSLEEKKLCFLAGADCWLPRPVDPEETALLLWSLARRWGGGLQSRVELGKARLEEETRELCLGEQRLSLPPREYAVLSLLMSHPRRVFSRQEVADKLWDLGCESGPRAVDVYVARLRKKCGEGWDFSIETVRGLGYRLVEGAPENAKKGALPLEGAGGG